RAGGPPSAALLRSATRSRPPSVLESTEPDRANAGICARIEAPTLGRHDMKNLLAPRTLEFAVTINEAAKSAAEHADIMAEPGFGKHFTDHMVDICWSEVG